MTAAPTAGHLASPGKLAASAVRTGFRRGGSLAA